MRGCPAYLPCPHAERASILISQLLKFVSCLRSRRHDAAAAGLICYLSYTWYKQRVRLIAKKEGHGHPAPRVQASYDFVPTIQLPQLPPLIGKNAP